jgi:hypothetical protein
MELSRQMKLYFDKVPPGGSLSVLTNAPYRFKLAT